MTAYAVGRVGFETYFKSVYLRLILGRFRNLAVSKHRQELSNSRRLGCDCITP